ncbi:MAG: alpha/beta hydrolase [Acidobacteriota bacterium]
MRLLLAGLLVAALYQGGVLLVVRLGWRNPRVRSRRTPAEMGLPFEEIRFPTAGGKKLYGWWIPSGKEGAPLVLLVHGWGRNAERMLPYVKALHPAGLDLLVFDARHHGASDPDGYASMVKFSEDIGAAVEEGLRRCPNHRPAVGVLGLSVGGSAAIHAAARDPRITAVATVGAFATPADPRVTLGRAWWVLAPGLPLAFRLIERRIGFRFREVAPEGRIGAARARFLLIHGERDRVVPVSHGRRLAAAAGERGRLWILPGRGHSDPHEEPGVLEGIRDFFRETLG